MDKSDDRSCSIIENGKNCTAYAVRTVRKQLRQFSTMEMELDLCKDHAEILGYHVKAAYKCKYCGALNEAPFKGICPNCPRY